MALVTRRKIRSNKMAHFLEGKVVVNLHAAQRDEQGELMLMLGIEPSTIIVDGTPNETWQEDYAYDVQSGRRELLAELGPVALRHL